MATLPDLSTFDHWRDETTGATLTLPIRGKSYTWRSGDLSIWGMLTVRRLAAKAAEFADKVARGEQADALEIALTDDEQQRLDLDLLGDQLDQMTEDGVKWREALHVSATLLMWHLRGERAALDTWARKEEPADPPAPAASTTTAGSSTRTKRPARARSGGQTSSPTGGSSKRTSTASTKSTSATSESSARRRRAGS